ncbi:MAG: hypothetical protein R2827_16135 [Bdellovibrionales bacterium]
MKDNIGSVYKINGSTKSSKESAEITIIESNVAITKVKLEKKAVILGLMVSKKDFFSKSICGSVNKNKIIEAITAIIPTRDNTGSGSPVVSFK